LTLTCFGLYHQPQRQTGGIRGRTLYYDYGDYLKLGMYRNPNITYNSTIYLDELRCGPTRASVALPPMDGAVTGLTEKEEEKGGAARVRLR
jgi:hypothetical protein